jgi:hypothetical protein
LVSKTLYLLCSFIAIFPWHFFIISNSLEHNLQAWITPETSSFFIHSLYTTTFLAFFGVFHSLSNLKIFVSVEKKTMW